MGSVGFGRALRRALGAGLLAASIAAPPAGAQEFAPVDRPGPPLSVPPAQLAASLNCGGNLAAPGPDPVLLVPGTTITPEKNFSWNWIPAFNKTGRAWCTVELPGSSMGDIQIAGEYAVNAIRKMRASAGREIDIVGHSQGGMVPRWALRFWPDVRSMVDDQVGLAASNHGTLSSVPLCLVPCSPSFHQQTRGSRFLAALNSRQETFDGIDYTSIYTILDEVVTPNLDDSGSSSLRPGGGGAITNVAIQDVCLTDVTEHLAVGTISNTAYRLAVDALDNPGPAVPSRIPASVCLSPLMPGVNPLTLATDMADAALHIANTVATSPRVAAEPPLACYTTASCPVAGEPGATQDTKGTKKKSKAKKKKKKKRKKKPKRGGKRR